MTDQHAGQRVWSIVETSAFDPVARVSPHERLKDLRELPLILPSPSHGLRALIDVAFGRQHLSPRVHAEVVLA